MQKLQNTISGIKKIKLNTLTSNIHLNNTDHLAASHKKGTIKSTKSQLDLCFKKA